MVEMGRHRGDGGVGVAGRDQVDEAAVICLRASRMAAALVGGEDQVAARHQLAQEIDENAIVGRLGHDEMEFARQVQDPLTVAPRARRLLALDEPAQVPHGAASIGPPRRRCDEMELDGAACLDHLARLLRRRCADEGAAVALEADHPLLRQHQQHLANAGAAGLENAGQRILGQLGARRQSALGDGAMDLTMNAGLDRFARAPGRRDGGERNGPDSPLEAKPQPIDYRQFKRES